jgi:hypothetical protein
MIDSLSGELANVQSLLDVAAAKRFNPKIAATLEFHFDEEVFARLQRIREGAKQIQGARRKSPNSTRSRAGGAEIGHIHATAKLYAQTALRDTWADPSVN